MNQPPIHRLPSEVLLSVFLLLPKHRDILLSVCRGWRDLIITTSQFWTVISLCPFHWSMFKEPIPTEQWIPRLKLHLQRSGTMPLKVFWNFPSGFSISMGELIKKKKEITPKFQEKLITCLLEYAPVSRWRSLEIWGPGPYTPSRRILNRLRGPYMLQELFVQSERDEAPYLLERLEKSAVVIPRVHFRNIFEKYIDNYPTLFRGATTFSSEQIDSRVTDLCRNLSTLHITVLPYESCVMPQLQSLHVEQRFELEHFANVIAPSLKYLHIKNFAGYDQFNPATPYELPCLRNLTISGGELWPLKYFHASALDTLCIDPANRFHDWKPMVDRLLDGPNNRLSPSTLILNISLYYRPRLHLLQRFSRVKNVTLLLDFEEIIDPLVKDLLEFDRGKERDIQVTATDAKRSWQLCPDLTTLHFLLKWELRYWRQIDTDGLIGKAHEILIGRSGRGNGER